MVPQPDTVRAILVNGGSIRLAAAGLTPQAMQEYAAVAREGGVHVTFAIGSATLDQQLMNAIASIGSGHVTFDFA
jgi:hypothetical protein